MKIKSIKIILVSLAILLIIPIVTFANYIGVDEKSGPNQDQPGSDGIGDTSYIVGDVQDRYPFTEESGWEALPVPTYNVAVILSEPSDKSFEDQHDKAHFESIIEQVKDYYCENSFGKWDSSAKTCNNALFNLNFDVYDNEGLNYKLSQTQEHYGKNFPQVQEINLGFDGQGREIKLKDKDRTEQFVWDAINKADEDIDFNNYQGVIVVYWGDSQQKLLSLQKYRLSSQWWTPSFFPVPVNSPTESINNWIAVAENETKYVWSHELGHALGNILTGYPLCDLYPTANFCYDGGYGGSVVSFFDVMGSLKSCSVWCRIKDIVSYFSSFSKIKLGWFQENIVGYGNHTIESLETMKFNDAVARYNLPNNSYYFLEARTNDFAYSKWDTDLPDDPLIIYKVSPKEVTVDNQTTTINFVNVAGTVGLIDFLGYDPPFLDPLDFPLKDPANNVLIGINNRIAEPDSFKIDAQISEYTLSNYIGAVLRPKLSLLEKIWEFTSSPFDVDKSYENRWKGDSPLGPGEEFYLHIFGYKIEQISEYASFRGYSGILRFLQWFILIPLILLLLLSRFCILKKIIPRIKSNRVINILQKVRRVILWIIIFLAVIFALSFSVSFSTDIKAATLDNLSAPYGVIYESVAADIDLHAYDEQGRHTGINYETGEYENQIPEAVASGDMVYDDEWIFVPEETNVRFVVSSQDVQEMLEIHPELQELTDGIEIYEVQAFYYNPESQKYESNIVIGQIEPGEELEHPIIGTTDIVVLPAIPWKVPKLLKENSITNLEESKTNDEKVDKEIDKIIQHIQNSLEDKKGSLWLDDWYLKPETRNVKVFDEQRAAVNRMLKDIEGKRIFYKIELSEETKEVFQEVINNLVEADKLLARAIIEDAKATDIKNSRFEKIVKYLISKAEKEYEKGLEELEKPAKVIDRFSKSWLYAQLAIRMAEKQGLGESIIGGAACLISIFVYWVF